MYLKPTQRRTWAEISLSAVERNLLSIRNHVGENTKICCVIKANAYGHGAVELAKLYEKNKVDYFAVSNIEEALQLTNEGITKPILILGYTPPNCAEILSDKKITQCVYSKEYAEQLSSEVRSKGKNVTIHIKIDTGMRRIGFGCDSVGIQEVVESCKMPGLVPEGIFTHFSMADEGAYGFEYTHRQYEMFIKVVNHIEENGIHFQIRHCANSATICDYPEMSLDMVRAGIILYGLNPSEKIKGKLQIEPVLQLKTVISYIKELEAGEKVSYGGEYVAKRKMKVATLPIGYADGVFRSNYRNGLNVIINGISVPVIGRICMDQCMVDVSSCSNLSMGDEVLVYGKEINTVSKVADRNQTINYELVCAISERVPRVYL